MSLLPSRVDVSPSPGEPEVMAIEDDAAAEAFDALGSETSRQVLSAVYDEPLTPPEIRERVGTSLQNVHYHIEKLEAAGLLEPAGIGYSEKGNEMTVYAPATEAIVLFAGHETDRTRLERLLARVFGLALAVCLATVAFAVTHQWWLERQRRGTVEIASGDAAPSAESYDVMTTVTSGLDPVLAFFLGGCVVLVVLVVWWLLRPRLRARIRAQSR